MSRLSDRRLRRAAARRVLADPAGERVQPTGDASAALQDEVQSMQGIVELLEAVPAEAWRPIPAAVGASSRQSRWRRRINLSPALATAAVAGCLGLGFVAGSTLQGGSARPAAARGAAVVLRPVAAGSGGAVATAYMPAPGQMLLRVGHLPPSPPGTYYELWLMTDSRHLAPVAAFRIGHSGQAELSLELPDEGRRYVYLDISQQKLGGGTAHSGDSVLRGRIT
jgi:Anti-sigma-K factor rskA, C-terminal